MEGKDIVVLTCNEATNDNILSYNWYFNNIKQNDQKSKTFNIGNTRDKSGMYSCIVVNASKISMKSQEKTITFLCKLFFRFRDRKLINSL